MKYWKPRKVPLVPEDNDVIQDSALHELTGDWMQVKFDRIPGKDIYEKFEHLFATFLWLRNYEFILVAYSVVCSNSVCLIYDNHRYWSFFTWGQELRGQKFLASVLPARMFYLISISGLNRKICDFKSWKKIHLNQSYFVPWIPWLFSIFCGFKTFSVKKPPPLNIVLRHPFWYSVFFQFCFWNEYMSHRTAIT